ncbi:helix-turn-helix domain-containing protein [Streptomyces sp. NPDC101213]|uniref:helix-turn-helix domain-containing protein n=1 Tax=Streptomyces sp. NPDC101213 TaxID=3366130 RepID=UPI003823D21A
MRDDVEEFAALLRRLKDRTDRSYGSLARRVNMNTSTLHRYCTGEAVPQDFAPVERLAAFCEATREERLELHRVWLSAVAARQGARTADLAETAVPTPASGPGSEPASASEPGPGPGPGPGPDLEPASEPDTEPGPNTNRDGAFVGESRSAEPPGNGPDPDPPAHSSSLVPSLASPPIPSPAARPWYRSRRVLASTAVACALLATVLSTSALPDGRSSEAAASRAAGPRPSASGTPHRSADPSAATPPFPSASRSFTSSSSGREAPAPSTPGSGPTPAAKPATGVPLAWTTDSLVWDKGCDHDYVIDKPPAQVPPPPVEQDAGAWAATQGAVHGRHTMVQISVQGRSSTAVVLEALHVRVAGRGTPAAGRAYAMGQGCGSDLTPRRFTVDLDAVRPLARPKDGADTGQTVPAVHFPYRVSAEDPEVLLVEATAQAYDARWYLELDWSSEGRTGTIRIDDHGRPFRTTGIEGMPHYWYGTNDAGERAWVPSTE